MPGLLYHLAALAARLGIAYALGCGSMFKSLLMLGSIVVQDRHMLTYHLALALYHTGSDPVMTRAVCLVILAVLVAIFKSGSRPRNEANKQRPAESVGARNDHWTGPGKPLLFPCITTHTRLVPKMHSFVYSYLVVGVPVGWTGVCGGMISVAGEGPAVDRKREQKGWYHIDAGDYLERGNGHLGLRGKLDAHLLSQGADPKQYPHAYFVTAARFLGYHFNPISFWYLYGANKTLTAMVLEVNNTFGERRMYYLTPKSAEESGEKGEKGETHLFKQAWPKDFHVSPFNSRKGSYELLANDPLAPNIQGTGPITATVVLRSSHTHSKVVARLISERREEKTGNSVPVAIHSLDPAAMTLWQKTKFLVAWWWVGFATFPRIVKQAGILFFQKRLHVWFRPEPLATSMGRLADSMEQKLEAAFRLYLRHLVESVTDDDSTGIDKPLAVRYIPCGIPDVHPELMLSPSAARNTVSHDVLTGRAAIETDEIEFRVLTPVFYTRFIRYAHDVEALFCELRESGTIDITPQAAPALFAKRVLSKATLPPPLQIKDPTIYIAFKIIQKLRRRPGPIERPMTWPTNKYGAASSPSSPKSGTTPMKVSGDLRGFRPSAMDGFILSLGHEQQDLRLSYRSALISLFLADRVTFGSPMLLWVLRLCFRIFRAWYFAPMLLNLLYKLNVY